MTEMTKHNLSVNEWILLTNILFQSNNELNSCFTSKEKLGSYIGISRRQIYNIIDELIEKKWLKKLSNGYLKTTEKWLEIHSVQSVQKLHNDSAEIAHLPIKKEYKRGTPTELQVIETGKQLGYDKEVCVKFYLHYESLGWKGIIDFVPKLRLWNMNEKPKPKRKTFTDDSKLVIIS